MARENLNYSFLPGTKKVRYEDYFPLQEDLMKELQISTKQYYYTKRKRICNIPYAVKIGIEKVFAKYGITDPDEIWEITPAVNESASTINKS